VRPARMIAAMTLTPKTVGWLAAATTITIWTSFIVIARASVAHNLTPLDIVFLRILGAGFVLLPWAWWAMRRRKMPSVSLLGLSPLSWRATVFTGLLGSVLYASLAHSGFFFAPAAHASVLLPGSLPLWTTILAILVLKEKITRTRGIGLLCILGGGVSVGGASLLKAFEGGDVWVGDLLFMSAASCWAAYGVFVRRQGLDPVHTTIAVTVFSVFTYLPVYAVLASAGLIESHLLTAPGLEVVFQAVYQGVGTVVLAGIGFNLMIRYFGPIRTTMLTAVVPGLSAMGAALVLGEVLSTNTLMGLALVTAGILIGARRA
jgi:drug/metabolite transporter (DMT)-like permease